MTNLIKALHHWIKVQQFQLWLWINDACDGGKAPYKGMTAEEAYWASRRSALGWAFHKSNFNNLLELLDKADSFGAKLSPFKLALGFPTKAKDEQFATYKARKKFIIDNKLG